MYVHSAAADVNIADTDGLTPCDAAYNNGHIEVARYLREMCNATAGADYQSIVSLESSVYTLKEEIDALKRDIGKQQQRYIYFLLAALVVAIAASNLFNRGVFDFDWRQYLNYFISTN